MPEQVGKVTQFSFIVEVQVNGGYGDKLNSADRLCKLYSCTMKNDYLTKQINQHRIDKWQRKWLLIVNIHAGLLFSCTK